MNYINKYFFLYQLSFPYSSGTHDLCSLAHIKTVLLPRGLKWCPSVSYPLMGSHAEERLPPWHPQFY